MGQKKHSPGTKQQDDKSTGGREFGQVVEPMQAEMASGNQGLAEDSGKRQETKKPERKGKKAA